MSVLADFVSIERPDVRSVSLEQDLDNPAPLKAYSPPVAALQLLDAVRAATDSGARLRAWSVIGPYGAGKSTFAHLLTGVFGTKGHPVEVAAHRSLRAVDKELSSKLRRRRSALGIADQGMVVSVATGSNERLSTVIARALADGSQRYWAGRPGRNPSVVSKCAALSEDGPAVKVEAIVEAFDDLSEHAPVLLILDEFGKVLQNEASTEAEELYLMQLLAERVSNAPTVRGLIITLQHLSFEESTVGLSPAARQEWRKVEGRFEPRVFDADTSHAVAAIARSVDHGRIAYRKAVDKVIRTARQVAIDAGVKPEVLGDDATYPLHPFVPPVAASLAGRLGQHDRSLAAFLASEAPNSVASALATTETTAEHPGFVAIDTAYDYFVTSASLNDLRAGGERYREIHDRILEADRLDVDELRVLKGIGALNLAGSDQLRASEAFLSVAFPGLSAQQVRASLEALTKKGLLTYRRFADEFRVWEGSDFDVAARVEENRRRHVDGHNPRQTLLRLATQQNPVRPVVARRHSHQTCTLRYFEARYEIELGPKSLQLDDKPDGLLIYFFGESPTGVPSASPDGRPVVVVSVDELGRAEDAAAELLATLETSTSSPELERDAVARREMRHRLGNAQQTFVSALREALDPGNPNASVTCGGEPLNVASQKGLEGLLSDLCDQAFPKTPVINSEMLNRRELTSQGAKARRALIGAMFDNAGDELLGFEGFGPERAMLGSVLTATGLYRECDDGFEFTAPYQRSSLAPAWRFLMKQLDRALDDKVGCDHIYAGLQAPPFGMKEGPLPVLLTAALIVRAEDVMLFEAGSYVPRVGPEHLERLLKTPERFALKRMPDEVIRADVLAQIADAVGAESLSGGSLRNQGALSVLRPMISLVRQLSEYTLQTTRISVTAQKVREALLTTREPDELLFVALPAACGYAPLQNEASLSESEGFAGALGEAILELTDAQRDLMRHVHGVLGEVFGIDPTRLREGLGAQAAGMERHVIEPKMRSFVLLAQEKSSMDDADWLDALAMNLVDRPPQSWTDADIATFEAMAAQRARWLQRLELLFQEDAGRQDAARLTLTLPDGRETSGLLDPPEAIRDAVASSLDAILESLVREHGPDASAAALLQLAERLLNQQDPETTETEGTA